MTTPDNRPTVPPVVGGIYLKRGGIVTQPLKFDADDNEYYDDYGVWLPDGRSWSEETKYDLVELIGMAVPIAELEQLRRAQAACEMMADIEDCKGMVFNKDNNPWADWLAHHRKAES